MRSLQQLLKVFCSLLHPLAHPLPLLYNIKQRTQPFFTSSCKNERPITMIRNFDDFCRELQSCGFSMGGGNAKGIFALIDFDWQTQSPADTPVRWHTGDPETDPWEWRMRVLEERSDVAYAKVFFKTSGFITREWYPHFLAVRRGSEALQDAYEDGRISRAAKRIYDIVSEGPIALHEIKTLGGFGRDDKSAFDRALIELQMGMYITMTGRRQKKNKYGIEYGWNSTVFATVEDFWAERGCALPENDAADSYEKIRRQVCLLNPAADKKTVRKFITGR